MKRKSLEVEFTIKPLSDGLAEVTAHVLRQTVRRKTHADQTIVFGEEHRYVVRSNRHLEIHVDWLYLHGSDKPDIKEATRTFVSLDAARAAVAAWTRII